MAKVSAPARPPKSRGDGRPRMKRRPQAASMSGAVEPVGQLGTALGLLEQPELYDTHIVLSNRAS